MMQILAAHLRGTQLNSDLEAIEGISQRVYAL